MSDKWTLGLAISHNGSACLLQGNKLVVAMQEERLTRIKRRVIATTKPSLAVEYCLKTAGIKIEDVSLVCLSVQGHATSPVNDISLNPQLRVLCGKAEIQFIPHHLSHAAYALALSGYEKAAILVVDAVGSPAVDWTEAERRVAMDGVPDPWEWMSSYTAAGNTLVPLEKHTVKGDPSVNQNVGGAMPVFWGFGNMYSAVAQIIFGDRLDGAGKVMGLAPFGKPTFLPDEFFEYRDGRFFFKDGIVKHFPSPVKWGQEDKRAENLAASVQLALEEGLLAYLKHLHARTGLTKLCFCGGCALNGVANERILRESAFKEAFFPPAAEDSGTSVGAAYAGIWQRGEPVPEARPGLDFLGATYSAANVERCVPNLPVQLMSTRDPVAYTADRLQKGKIAGWFQGGGELGPRALGHRSILCDATFPDAKDRLNLKIKKRESFRPFAPVILAEDANTLFKMDGTTSESPFMLRVVPFREEFAKRFPAVAHVDGTGRLQTVDAGQELLKKLLQTYKKRTGFSLLLNTSLNIAGEPLAETPEDAIWDMLEGGLDFLVCGERVIEPFPRWDVLDLLPTAVGRFLGCKTQEAHFGKGSTFYAYSSGSDSTIGGVFEISSQWGTWEQFVGMGALTVIKLCDGHKTGWQIVDILGGAPGPTKDDALRSLLFLLRRYRILTLSTR